DDLLAFLRDGQSFLADIDSDVDRFDSHCHERSSKLSLSLDLSGLTVALPCQDRRSFAGRWIPYRRHGEGWDDISYCLCLMARRRLSPSTPTGPFLDLRGRTYKASPGAERLGPGIGLLAAASPLL
ncbi:MAG: hypothetical protein R6V61_07645, partial [Wenzhouxiangellaceae bacterium]